MINYILFIPGSWLIGYFPNTRDKLVLWVFHLFGTIIPQDIITKYQKQFAIHFTHIVPRITSLYGIHVYCNITINDNRCIYYY